MLGFLDHTDRDIHIHFLLHDPVMKNKAMLVFNKAHHHTQCYRYPRFPFTDPFRIGFKNGKYFFLMRNLLTLNNSAVDLIKLSPGVIDKIFYFQYLIFIYSGYLLEFF